MASIVKPNLPEGPKLWYMRLSSFSGTVAWAEHWYAELDPGGAGPDGGHDFDRFDVEYKLSAEEAARRRSRDRSFNWRAGMACRGFQSREDAVAGSLAAWEELKDDGDSISDDVYNETLLAGPEGNEHTVATRYGAGAKGRRLTALVERSTDGWKLSKVTT